MTYKSSTQPHCLWCSKRIAKRTTSHDIPGAYTAFKTNQLVTRADLKSNERIVSVNYSYEYGDETDQWGKALLTGRRSIHSYTTWDGESYVDQFFCNGDHARQFGYAAAVHGLRLKRRNAA